MELVTYKQKHTNVSDINVSLLDKEITVNGWLRNTRIQAAMAFLELFDGSTSKTIQLITEDLSHLEQLGTLYVGTSLSVKGVVVRQPQKKDAAAAATNDLVEVKLTEILYIGRISEPLTYILNAKKTSLETLRDHQDVRVKTRTFNAVFRIRAGLSKATHDFFHSKGFHHLNPNMVTTSDCEGGGEVFTITTLLNDTTKQQKVDFTKDFFEKQAFLTVSSQLQLELLCAGLGKVWTSNKSFRSEKSKTNRHLAEFEHIEWETAWSTLDDLMDQSEEYTQFCFNYVLKNHADDVEELNKFTSKGLLDKLKLFTSKPYRRMTYDDALQIIEENKKEIKKLHKDLQLPKWGDDLGSECEKYIAEVICQQPVFVYNYPKTLKSFYMKQNDDNRTVQGCDLLVPQLGELIGSSVREHDYDKLMATITERKMDVSKLKWYIDLRLNAPVVTGGGGLGFDRLVRICTGMENIRDAVPFPVAYQECRF